MPKARNYLIEHPDDVWATLKAVQRDPKFRQRDFEEFGAMSRDSSATAVQVLLGWGMIHRLSQGYIRMDKALVAVLNGLEQEGY
jgi:hypothetical protein